MTGRETKRISDLVRLLEEISSCHETLGGVVQSKIDAMRRADMDGMRMVIRKEHQLVRRIHECEGLRRQLTDAIGQQMGLPAGRARSMTLSQLADRLSEAEGQKLKSVAGKLREALSQVVRLNRLAGAISARVLGHLKAVFDSVATDGDRSVGYSGSGRPVTVRDSRLLEAVG